MRRGALLMVLLLVAWLRPAQAALAASTVELKHASDGTLLVVGEGWRPGQLLVVSLGQDRFTASVDSAGDFEVLTGVIVAQGPLAVHHAAPSDMPMLELDGAAPRPSPLATALVESLAEGLRILAGMAVAGVALALLAAARRRYPRP